jgi:hypothetical protein
MRLQIKIKRLYYSDTYEMTRSEFEVSESFVFFYLEGRNREVWDLVGVWEVVFGRLIDEVQVCNYTCQSENDNDFYEVD